MSHNPAVDTLLAEYSEMRQELRDALSSLDTNLRAGIALLGILVTAAAALKDYRILCAAPSAIFMCVMFHLTKCVHVNTLGLYCHLISTKIKRALNSPDVLMEWEGGVEWTYAHSMSRVTYYGIALALIPVAVAFVALSAISFEYCKWSLILSAAELCIILGYVMYTRDWATPDGQAKRMAACAAAAAKSSKS